MVDTSSLGARCGAGTNGDGAGSDGQLAGMTVGVLFIGPDTIRLRKRKSMGVVTFAVLALVLTSFVTGNRDALSSSWSKT